MHIDKHKGNISGVPVFCCRQGAPSNSASGPPAQKQVCKHVSLFKQVKISGTELGDDT